MQEFLTIFALLLVYGAFHSLLAANGVKVFFLNLIGKRAYLGLYRLFYNIFAIITLFPILAIVTIEPGDIIWQVNAPLSYLLVAIQIIGLIGLTISLLQIDGMRFLGLRQAAAWLNGDKLPLLEEPLQQSGLYALVRHPLYLFSILFIWPNTTMTVALLGFNIGITIYFVFGSLLEEQKLLRAFGDTYARYKAEVPWLIPFLRLGRINKPISEQLPE